MRLLAPFGWFTLSTAALAFGSVSVGAQTEVTLEVGASAVTPPSDVEGDAGRFAVGGVRVSRLGPRATGVTLSLLAGRSLDATSGGDFFSGSVGGRFAQDFGAGWSAGLDARAFGFEVTSPFPYRALALEGGPVLRYRSAHASVRLAGVGGVGSSRVELRRRAGGAVRVVEDELWRYGATGELLLGSRTVMAGLAGGMHETAGGSYTTGGARLIVGDGRVAGELRLDVWDTPLGTTTTGGLALIVPVGSAWSLRGFFGRSEPDPLTLAEPGGGSGGVLVGRRVYASPVVTTRRGTALHEVLKSTEAGAVVRFWLMPPPGTREVRLLGDFTLWESVSMQPKGEGWELRLPVKAGTHHFGFLVDDEWYVPEDAPDVVPDEWGRLSATLVIER
jgi:Glycogen recognition site of AMP-activated protein kinase